MLRTRFSSSVPSFFRFRPSFAFSSRLSPLQNKQNVLAKHSRSFSSSVKFDWNNYLMSIPTTSLPHSRLNWKLSAKEITTLADVLIEKSKAVIDQVASVPLDQVSYENVIKPLAQDAVDSALRSMCDFPQHVSSEKEVREASTEADKKLSNFDVEKSMRVDLYRVVQAYHDKGPKLEPEADRLLKKIVRDFKRNGLHLSDEKRSEVKALKERMSQIEIQFNQNLNEEKTELLFTKEELNGVTDDFLSALEQTEGKYKVTLKYPHYFPLMKKCSVPETRKKMETAFNSRCINENTKILEELVELRQKHADILGYPNHAAYITEVRMAKNPQNIKKFLSELSDKLQPLAKRELDVFLKLKKEEDEKAGRTFDGVINSWDFRYYSSMVEEKEYGVDHNQLKDYFPMEHVTNNLLEMYQSLLGLKFEKIPNAEVWHPDVELFKVIDTKSGQFMGYFYLDLFPREGKYGHAACFGLQPGCENTDGTPQACVAAMVANFTKPLPDKPSLLLHDEVETYFHEFGHVMHQICGRTKFAEFSGTRVERDFVEAPSQMLENWVWEPKSLIKLSNHYVNHVPLPDSVIEKLIKSRLANAGLFNKRQILLATFDQMIHSTNKVDTAALYAQLAKDILCVPATPGTNMPANFGHLAGGYDAQYYGYLWSEVFCMDMFVSRFEKEGIFNSNVGADYRNYILAPGGTVDGSDMLKNFLGRDPQQEAFLKSKGL